MKIYILAEKEGWITDVLEKEWIECNKNIYTNNYQEADIIWVLSDYIIQRIPLAILMKKKVITTIHHMVPNKMTPSLINHYKYLDKVSNKFHVICNHTYNQLKEYVTKPIETKLFWTNTKEWYPLFNSELERYNIREKLRQHFNLDNNKFIIGSFQKDTEGASIANKTYLPKLEKGPDQFIKCVKKIKDLEELEVEIVLSGFGRQYLMKELDKMGIKYYYFNMISQTELNKLYHCLDLYIVSSRYEGGPRSIHECAANKTPIISTNVGVAPDLLASESIFDMNEIENHNENFVKPNINIAYNNVCEYSIPKYFDEFNSIFTF
jgi:glycosyltransferase involved in cell wall biosynthesis